MSHVTLLLKVRIVEPEETGCFYNTIQTSDIASESQNNGARREGVATPHKLTHITLLLKE
jgi:hypothetical protein